MYKILKLGIGLLNTGDWNILVQAMYCYLFT